MNTDLATKLYKVTEEGRLTDWNERIGIIARSAGADMQEIDWSGAPVDVAFRVYEYFDRVCKLNKLEKEISVYAAGQRS